MTDNVLAQEIGKKIREKRKEMGVSQDAFARDCQIDRSYMGRIERGEANITITMLYQIARNLNCDPTTLLPAVAIAG